MKLHSNAKSCPNCRRVMVQQVLSRRRNAVEVAADFGVSSRTLFKWLHRYRQAGGEGLLDRSSRRYFSPRRYPVPSEELKRELFATLHAPPSAVGLNRTTWRIPDLLAVVRQRGFATNLATIRRLIRDAGYRWRKARVVLTSNDRRFREKVDRVHEVLSRLKSDEAFFSIDEFGPFAIRLRGGRALVPPGEPHCVPQWQKSRGSLIVVAALELATNQVTHFFSHRKNTAEMIGLVRRLLEQYSDRRHVFLSWDAAPWHRSKALFEHIATHNAQARAANRTTIEVVPLPARAQFLNVIESVFSGMARAIIHNSDYASVEVAQYAIKAYFAERNAQFLASPQCAGKKIWGKERVPSAFEPGNNCKAPRYERVD
jgi:transposase